MLTFKQYINEVLEKNKWTHLLSQDRHDYSFDLISLVQNAYRHTTLGGFVNSLQDVRSSDWLALDFDDNPDVDVALFYRGPRTKEVWTGKKIQGIGHDSTSEAKDKALRKMVDLLGQRGWWIEASSSVAKALLSRGLNPVKNQQLLKKLFPSIEKFNDDGSYVRPGPPKAQFVFGIPII